MTKEKFTIPGVGAIIESEIDGEDKILIQQRSKNPIEGTGVYEIPAGKIREYENIFDCLRREVKEETGLDIIKIFGEEETIEIIKNDYRVINYQPFCCSQNTDGVYPIMVHTFICSAKGELLKKSSESKNIRWVNMKELTALLENDDCLYPMHITTLKKYLEYKVQE